jgi:hypothetical protein
MDRQKRVFLKFETGHEGLVPTDQGADAYAWDEFVPGRVFVLVIMVVLLW